MYSLTKTKIKNLLVTLLTLTLTLALLFMSACNDGGSTGGDNDNTNNTETEETITDYQVIKNGDFEFATTETSKFPYSTSINWTRSTDSDKNTATASTASSGIIDTTQEVWEKLKDNEKPQNAEGTAVNPGTPKSTFNLTSSYDKDDEDKRVNPQLDGNKILMINNKSSVDGLGSAQKFKSSSTITVPVDSYAIISVYVRTDNIVLKSGEKGGAYVLITDKVGSYSYKNIEYRDINTNGKWEKIETVIKGSTFNSTIFNVTLGLGRGNGTFKADYVEGFAFFDNIEATVYSAAEFKALGKTYDFTKVSKDTANYNEYSTPTTNNTITKAYSYEYVKGADVTNLTPTANENYGYNTENILPSTGYDLANGNKIGGANANDSSLPQPIKDAVTDIKDAGLESNAKLIYFNFANASTGFYTTDKINIEADGRHYITFYAKTSVNNENIKMAKVSLINTTVGEETTTLSAVTSFTTTSVTDSAYGEWVKYSILVNNPTDTTTDYRIKFVFGDDESTLISDVYKLQKGYAIFAGLNVETIAEEDYNLISEGSTVSKQTVYGKYSNYTEDETSSTVKDSYSINPDKYGEFEIQTKPTTYIPNFIVKGDKSGTKVGIVNSKYNYDFLTASEKTSFKNLKESSNENAQLILFKSSNTASQLLTSRKVITANAISQITIKLRVLDGATVKIRLVDSTPNDDGSYNALSLTGDNGDTKELVITATKDTLLTENKWSEVCFYVAAGNEDINYRVEFSFENGKTGTMFLHSATDNLASIETVAALDAEIKSLGDEFEEIGIPYNATLSHTRAPATVLSTDDDGNDVTSTRTFEATEIYTSNNVYTFAKFNTIFADTEIDERVSEDDTTEEETEEEDKGYQLTSDLGLQISSLVLALALIAVLVVVVVKTVKKKTIKQKATVKEYYSRNARDEAMEKIAKKKAKIDLSSNSDEEYDYDEAEQIGEEVIEEEVEETSSETEEAVIDVEELSKEPDVVIEEPTNEVDGEEEVSSETPSEKTEETKKED